MHVARDRVGQHALAHHPPRDLEREIDPVADVEMDAALQRLVDHPGHRVPLAHDSVRHRAVDMGERGARVQHRHHLLQDAGRIGAVGLVDGEELAGVDVKREPGRRAGLDRHLQHLEPPVRQPARLAVALDALDQAGIGRGRLGDRLDAHHAGVVEDGAFHPALERAGEVGRDEGPHVGLGGPGDIGVEPAHGPRAGTSLVDDRGGARMHPRLVRMEPEIGHPLIDVDVKVDQPGADRPAARVDPPVRAMGRELGRERRDPPVRDPDLGGPAIVAAGVDRVVAGDDEVVEFGHGATPRLPPAPPPPPARPP